nr:hypothetical protein Iba_chr05bCG1920 [Ipomoea batatas]GMC99070.1 hypothetical protein Iba_chr05eCG2210 [Ipomoea batatas]GME12518.1 hypothetical protein Iba_scaffold13909CG0010 [Ipomoea batatas]
MGLPQGAFMATLNETVSDSKALNGEINESLLSPSAANVDYS